MKKINSFLNRYPVSKTLKFSLIPVGKTEENFNTALLLENDKLRAEKYGRVKEYIDRYHKHFIDEILAEAKPQNVNEYAELYFKTNKSEKELKSMETMEDKLRKSISAAFTKDSRYKKMMGKEMTEEILPSFLTSKDEISDVEAFYGFATYFTQFYKNRENMYSSEAKASAIAYRCINENLPRFLDNVKKFKLITEALPAQAVAEADAVAKKCTGFGLGDIFCVDYYGFALAQSDIDRYNNVIGGFVDENGNKIKGLNEHVNFYNQQAGCKVPLLTPLYKQILSDKNTISFIPEKFGSDNEVTAAVNEFYTEIMQNCLDEIARLFENMESYNFEGIFSAASAKGEISNGAFGRWDAVSLGRRKEYEKNVPPKKNQSSEKYIEAMDKALKNKATFSLAELQRFGEMFKTEECIGSIEMYLKNIVAEKVAAVKSGYNAAKSLLTSNYEENNSKGLKKNEAAIDLLKNLLDSIKELEHVLKWFKGTGKEENKDFSFYAEFDGCYEALSEIDRLYDKVRNYVTQKPYSKDKIKLNFDNSHFMSGWAQGYETKGAVLFRDSQYYYIGIVNKKYDAEDIKKLSENAEASDFERIVYDFQKPDNKNTPRLFIRSKGATFAPSVSQLKLPINDVLDIYDNGWFRAEYRKVNEEKYKDSLVKMIDYFKQGFSNHESYKHYSFNWKNSDEYKDIAEFYADTIHSCYELRFEKINYEYVEDLINRGELYLFKIYNKDFSPHSHGKQNLHTMYFKMLFDERNLKNVVYQLNGGAEMFYREASLKKEETAVHKANQPIKNKNADNPKQESVFKYDIIKDKRFTERSFALHVPITLNFKAGSNSYLNTDVRLALKNHGENYVIGIDRGERNLLYVCVIDSNGNIVEQKSLNEIVSDNNYKVNYHKLLDSKELQRDKARKNWGTIENIKELKEGYLSQVIHQICEYVIKYDAIIALEDLNFGFKRGRFKVEKQVYQKFENMLCTKLNYLVLKDEAPENPGGLLNAYQLTNEAGKVNRARQNGIIFYVPAWLTSKIDPVTGFVDLLKPKYTSVKEALEFIEKIDDIRFNDAENIFEFDIDYAKFPKTAASHKKKWTVCTNGERIINRRNAEKNNMWDNETIVPTDEFKALFCKYNVDCSENIKESILKITDASFHKSFMKLLSYTLQMRNSLINNTEVDYLISPVKDSNGVFYDSRRKDASLPENADANGAYNIARKALWAISVLKNTDADAIREANLSISNAAWLEYAQK